MESMVVMCGTWRLNYSGYFLRIHFILTINPVMSIKGSVKQITKVTTPVRNSAPFKEPSPILLSFSVSPIVSFWVTGNIRQAYKMSMPSAISKMLAKMARTKDVFHEFFGASNSMTATTRHFRNTQMELGISWGWLAIERKCLCRCEKQTEVTREAKEWNPGENGNQFGNIHPPLELSILPEMFRSLGKMGKK